ncbi:putative AB-hydrolase YheT [Chondrocystis sp. NIES-4102]|nr:putative AB-hydrolase YheT [Chondrocystis sp. NIES-4102]
MLQSSYSPPPFLNNGLLMTVYTAFAASQNWEKTLIEPQPQYQQVVFTQGEVPLYGWVAIPPRPRGTIIGTYGITGSLDNQWFLKILGRKAYAENYAVVLFDWRAHGKSAELSPTLTSDGINEGKDIVYIAGESKALGCPAPFWLTGYSLGGQLALWGIYYSQFLEVAGLKPSDIAGGAVICPNLDSNRSLPYLMQHPTGKYVEKAIARSLKELVRQLHFLHPQELDLDMIEKINTIWEFDRQLVIPRLGFASVEEYFTANSPFRILPKINKPTLILYAEDDPVFDPAIIDDLKRVCEDNDAIDLMLTKAGGHVSYVSSLNCQKEVGDRDCWWAWNRVLQWCNRLTLNDNQYLI